MKRRIFYVLHLDRNRIFFLSFSFLSLLLFSFALGRYLGQTQFGSQEPQKFHKFPLFSSESSEASKKKQTAGALAEALTAKDGTEAVNMNQETVLLKEEAPQRMPEPIVNQRGAASKGAEPKNTTLASKVLKRSSSKKKNSGFRSPPMQKPAAQNFKRVPAQKVLLSQSSLPKKKKSESIKKSKQKKGALRLANITKTFPSKTKSKFYHLQLGAFRSRDAAQRMQKELKAQGFRTRVKKRKNVYLVRVGQKLSLEELQEIEGSLRQEKYFPIRVREKK